MQPSAQQWFQVANEKRLPSEELFSSSDADRRRLGKLVVEMGPSQSQPQLPERPLPRCSSAPHGEDHC